MGVSKATRLYLLDKKSNLVFLVDTGADVSVVPRPKGHVGKPSSSTSFAENKTPVRTYGVENRTVEFAEGKNFSWPFYTSKVPYLILGGWVR